MKFAQTTRLVCTVMSGGQEHLKIKTRLKDEKFASEMGECVLVVCLHCDDFITSE
jgi:hypothetical protein